MEYELVGDYYIPILKLNEESRLVGRYGRLYREYLRETSPVRFNNLVLSGELWTYLDDVNELAEERVEVIIRQLKVAEGVTEDLKAENQMEWVGRMNNIKNRAEEIVLAEFVYI